MIKNQTFHFISKAIILSIALFFSSQYMLMMYTNHWGIIPLFCGIILTCSFIFMAIKWIFSYESTNDNELPQTLIEDIEPAFEMIRPIPIVLVCLGIFFVRIPFLTLAQLKPFEKMIHHLETLLHMNGDVAIQTKTLVQKPFIQTESTLINVSINILLMVVILPIVEELLFRELIPYILSTVTKNQYFSTSSLSLGLSSLVFVLLHFSQSISTLFALILLTIALTVFRMKYGLLQSMALHQCWNAINVTLMLISILK